MSIRLKDVSFSYFDGNRNYTKALDKINLELPLHKMIGIVGHTGCGKSTLMQHLNGLLFADEGEVKVNQFIVSKKNRKQLRELRQKVGFLFQFSENQLFEENVYKDIAFGLNNFKIPKEQQDARIKKAIQLVNLDASILNRSCFELSGGQKRKVALAGVLVMEPEIIIVDEPSAGLDPRASKEIMDLFSSLVKEQKLSILMVSHNHDHILNYCDELVYLDHGKIVYHGDILSFFHNDEMINRYQVELPMVLQFQKKLENYYQFDNNEKNINDLYCKVKL